jgi:hypothetical protein
MPHYISRSDFDKLPQEERRLRISEGVIVRDDDWEQQEIRAERIKFELDQWRREHAPAQMKLADFNAMSQPERTMTY